MLSLNLMVLSHFSSANPELHAISLAAGRLEA
jgi:hypothetical protein